MQTFDLGLCCPECAKALIDADDELVCPSCGIVREKEVIEFPPSRPPVANDFTYHALGSYLGSAQAPRGEKYSRGLSESGSTLAYLKTVSDYAGRDGGASYECAKMVERVSEKLCLPPMVMAQAVVVANKLLPSRVRSRRVTIASVSAYALIAACKLEGFTSVSTRDILEAHRSLGRRVKVSSIIQLSLESEVKTEARRPEDYLQRIIARVSQIGRVSRILESDNVKVTPYFLALRELAQEILSAVDEDLKAGRRPGALAATAIYAAELLLARRETRRRRITQRDVATCGDTAEYTVREQYRHIFTPAIVRF